MPDLVHACLDLLIDKEKDIWRLTNGTAVTWLELALMAAKAAGTDFGEEQSVSGTFANGAAHVQTNGRPRCKTPHFNSMPWLGS